jgi:protein-tyrosine-phosphatase
MDEQHTVMLVCPHGAGKSRMAAAWFNVYAPPGWRATTAGVVPQSTVSVHAPRLLAGTAAADRLDDAPPRAMEDVPDARLLVAIDCAPSSVPPTALHWRLQHGEFDAPMADEIRALASELARQVEQPAGAPDEQEP